MPLNIVVRTVFIPLLLLRCRGDCQTLCREKDLCPSGLFASRRGCSRVKIVRGLTCKPTSLCSSSTIWGMGGELASGAEATGAARGLVQIRSPDSPRRDDLF